MAAPNVTGSLLLLQQHYKNLNNGDFMRASTLKGLALHTADDAGFSGPDAVFGWGLLNAKKAAETITQKGNQSKIEELTLTSGQTYTITVNSDGSSPLLASISWTDRPGIANTTVNSTTPVLVNDLDIRVSKGETTYLPYELTSPTSSARRDNNVDPYERIDINNASGEYTITESHKGSLTSGSQNYSLIVTGITGTNVTCNATRPKEISTSSVTSTQATISWTIFPGATYDLRYRNVGSSLWTNKAVSSASSTLSDLSASTQYEIQIRSKCTSGKSNYSSSIKFSTKPSQVNYCQSNGNRASHEWIDYVSFGGMTNASGTNRGYRDFTSKVANVTRGSSNQLVVSAGFRSTAYNEYFTIWIDYNRDGDFNDKGEKIASGNSNSSGNRISTITIPSDAKLGQTRMRVSMKYGGNPTSCENFADGEVEDYMINIKEASNNISKLNPGMFILEVYDGQKTLISKFIK